MDDAEIDDRSDEEARLPKLANAPDIWPASYWSDLVRELGIPVVAASAEGLVTTFNLAAERLFGYSAKEALGRSYDFLFVSGVEDCARIDPGDIHKCQAYARRKKGPPVAVRLTASRIGLTAGAILILDPIDIGPLERTSATGAFQNWQQLQSNYIANINHEIRTPLNVIVGYSEHLEDMLSECSAADLNHAVNAISGASKRLVGTIQNVLDWSRLEAGTFVHYAISTVVHRIVESQIEEFRISAERKGLAINWSATTCEDQIEFDEYCLSRVVSILLDNAIKFTDKGEINLRLFREADQLCLEIRDTGVGMHSLYVTKAFLPFSQEDGSSTRKFEGAGLGLAVASRCVALNGAHLLVSSEKNVGTQVTVKFRM